MECGNTFADKSVCCAKHLCTLALGRSLGVGAPSGGSYCLLCFPRWTPRGVLCESVNSDGLMRGDTTLCEQGNKAERSSNYYSILLRVSKLPLGGELSGEFPYRLRTATPPCPCYTASSCMWRLWHQLLLKVSANPEAWMNYMLKCWGCIKCRQHGRRCFLSGTWMEWFPSRSSYRSVCASPR